MNFLSHTLDNSVTIDPEYLKNGYYLDNFYRNQSQKFCRLSLLSLDWWWSYFRFRFSSRKKLSSTDTIIFYLLQISI